MITIELVGHMAAGDRRLWTEDQDLRPLSELGRRQAARMAEALSNGPVDGLYSSPALRCRQTLEPLAARFGLPIVTMPELRETDGFLPPPGWDGLPPDLAPAMGGAYAAGRASSALRQIMTGLPEGRVVACSHGDVVPALIAFLIGANGLTLPPLHAQRGGWYTIRADEANVRVEHRDVLPDFPIH
jgi:8-oxo-dGTP diphosphatase